MPKLATLGFCVRSVICAHAGAPHQIVTPPEMRNKNSAVNFKLASFIGLLLLNYFRTPGVREDFYFVWRKHPGLRKAKNDRVLPALVRESQEAIHTDETFSGKHFTQSEVFAY
jgi:hypothetical protein